MKLSEAITSDILQQFHGPGVRVSTIGVLCGPYVEYVIRVYNVSEEQKSVVHEYISERVDSMLYHDKMVGPYSVMIHVVTRKNTRQHYYETIKNATKFNRRIHNKRICEFTPSELMCMYMSEQLSLLTDQLEEVKKNWSRQLATILLDVNKQR